MNNWISVKDWLPIVDGDYLVNFTNGFRGKAEMRYFDPDDGEFKSDISDYGFKITHWMSLPEPIIE